MDQVQSFEKSEAIDLFLENEYVLCFGAFGGNNWGEIFSMYLGIILDDTLIFSKRYEEKVNEEFRLYCKAIFFEEIDSKYYDKLKECKIQVIIACKDTIYWTGHYGARINGIFVRFVPCYSLQA